jgi:RNA-binding protein 23/39
MWVISISASLKAIYRMYLNLLASSSLFSCRRKSKVAAEDMALSSMLFPYPFSLFELTRFRFRDPNQAREALEKMNGFDLAGRPIRVGLGNDKFTPESTASLLQRFQGQSHQQQFQGSAFSGAGGRGPQASSGSNFDRGGGRDNDKGSGGASALDDTDVGGVNFNNYSRDALMRKLARTDEPAPAAKGRDERREILKPKTETKPLPVNVNMASRCVVLKNMFDPAE